MNQAQVSAASSFLGRRPLSRSQGLNGAAPWGPSRPRGRWALQAGVQKGRGHGAVADPGSYTRIQSHRIQSYTSTGGFGQRVARSQDEEAGMWGRGQVPRAQEKRWVRASRKWSGGHSGRWSSSRQSLRASELNQRGRVLVRFYPDLLRFPHPARPCTGAALDPICPHRDPSRGCRPCLQLKELSPRAQCPPSHVSGVY